MVTGSIVAYDALVARIVNSVVAFENKFGIIVEVLVKNITRIYSSCSLEHRNTRFQGSVCVEIVRRIETVSYVPPYFTQLHAFPVKVFSEQAGFVVVFGDFGLRVIQVETYPVAYIAYPVMPVDLQFPAVCFQVCGILFCSTGTDYSRQFHSRSQHTFGITTVPVECGIQLVVEQVQVETEV